MHEVSKVVGTDLHFRKITIWIIFLWLITMFLSPVSFGLLLLDVVPCEDLFVRKIVIEIERSTRKVQSLCIWILCKELDDTLSKGSASTFMSFVYYDQVPFIHQNILFQLLIIVTTYKS